MVEVEALEALLAEAKRQTELLALLVLPQARAAGAQALDGEKERLVYGLSDGTRSVRQIGTQAGIPKSTVANWWKEWRRVGLAVDDKGGVRAVFPLEQLGLPQLPRTPRTRKGAP
jgi:hypothetical protein